MDNGNPVHSGRTILTALYLCMLAVCFLVPIFFYFRMHCDERRNRHLRELEIAGMTQAMNESQLQQMEESRAARRKYREERRARINQLFTPVRMVRSSKSIERVPMLICIVDNKNPIPAAVVVWLSYVSAPSIVVPLYICNQYRYWLKTTSFVLKSLKERVHCKLAREKNQMGKRKETK